jgi:hypothetical protein
VAAISMVRARSQAHLYAGGACAREKGWAGLQAASEQQKHVCNGEFAAGRRRGAVALIAERV